MKHTLRKITKRGFIIANLVAVAVFSLACFAAYINPARFWYIAILGVGFPFIIAVQLFFVCFWLFFRSRWALLSLGFLLLSWSQLNVVWAWHPFAAFNKTKPANTLRIMQWNVARLGQMDNKRIAEYSRNGILKFLKESQADVLCMEEFLESNKPKEMEENIAYISNHLHYPYYYFARDHIRKDNLYAHGVAIFSRFPILDSSRIRFAGVDSSNPGESLIHADIEVKGQRIRIFATHLQSLKFEGDDFYVLHRIAKADDSAVTKSKSVLRKFHKAYKFRFGQADLVRAELDKSPYPEILCGDFNDIPNSYSYYTIKGNRNDAFLKKGFGIGRTYSSLSPTLRIDYVMANKSLNIEAYKTTKMYYSDHFPLLVDFRIPDKD
jgi:endonuclease/exonuclease/phosphatase family metal-dependent hydrolase